MSGNGRRRALVALAVAVLMFTGMAAGLAYAQSYGSTSSSSSSSATCCCCCCIPVLLIVAAIWLGNNSKSKKPPQPAVVQAAVSPPQPVQVIYKEKETIREIVKVPCEYCGTLVEVTSPKCPSCGAPQKR